MAFENRHYPAIDARRHDMGVSKQSVADRLNLSWQSTDEKLSGKVEFDLTEVIALADWWGLSIDELVGRRASETPVYRIVPWAGKAQENKAED